MSIAWKVEHAFDRLMRMTVITLGVLLIAAVCLNFVNVIGRYAFGKALFGADEIQTYSMVWMAFAGAVVVTWRNAHLRMDVLVARAPPWLKAALRFGELILMAAMDRTSDAAAIPMAIPHSAVAVGFGLIALIALWRMSQPAMPRADQSETPP